MTIIVRISLQLPVASIETGGVNFTTGINIFPHILLTTAMMLLHNRINKEELKRKLQEETFTRRTISLYRYVEIDDPDVQVVDMRNHSRSKIYNRISGPLDSIRS